MFPALNDGDRLLVRRCHGNDPDIVLGDVVLVVRPDERTGWRGLTRGDARTQGWFVKRVAAEPEPSAGLFLVGDHPGSMDSASTGPVRASWWREWSCGRSAPPPYLRPPR